MKLMFKYDPENERALHHLFLDLEALAEDEMTKENINSLRDYVKSLKSEIEEQESIVDEMTTKLNSIESILES